MSVTPQSASPQRQIKKRKPRKPHVPIAEPEHFGYFARIPLPWILRIERQYRRAERAEERAKKRAEQRALKRKAGVGASQ
jgi:hypothetical protein